MIVIICAKYKKNPSRTVNATERTRFSKSRPNDLENIGQGQGSSHATHPLMLLIICTKYWKNPSWTVDATGRTRKVNRQTDRQTDGQTDRQTRWIQYTPPPLTSLRGYNYNWVLWAALSWWFKCRQTKIVQTPVNLLLSDIKCVEQQQGVYPDACQNSSLNECLGYLRETLHILLQNLFVGKKTDQNQHQLAKRRCRQQGQGL